jgi:hypothetical protein
METITNVVRAARALMQSAGVKVIWWGSGLTQPEYEVSAHLPPLLGPPPLLLCQLLAQRRRACEYHRSQIITRCTDPVWDSDTLSYSDILAACLWLRTG